LPRVAALHEAIGWPPSTSCASWRRPEPIESGMRVDLPHNFWAFKERRGATVRTYEKYKFAYGDYKLKDTPA
jgi:hypothetical protein